MEFYVVGEKEGRVTWCAFAEVSAPKKDNLLSSCTLERSEPKKFWRVSGTSFKRFLTRRRQLFTARRLAIAAHLLRCRTCFNPHRSAATPAVKTRSAPCSCTTLASLTLSGERRAHGILRCRGEEGAWSRARCRVEEKGGNNVADGGCRRAYFSSLPSNPTLTSFFARE